MNGIYEEMTNEEYHNDITAISSSGLKVILKTPRKFFCFYLDENKPLRKLTPDMDFGTLVHSLCLEPEKIDQEYYTMPQGIDRRTTEGKKLFSEFGKDHKVVKYDDMVEAVEIKKEILKHPLGMLIANALGKSEFTIFWDEEIEIESGVFATVKCKVRLDYFIFPSDNFKSGLILDIKTTQDADERFERHAYDLNYHISAAFYCRAVQKFLKSSFVPSFVFLAAEKDYPYEVCAHIATDDMLEKGWKECLKGLKRYAIGIKTGEWTGLEKETKEINLPRYAKENYV